MPSDTKDLQDGVKWPRTRRTRCPRRFLYGMGSTADGREMMNIGMKGWLDASYEID
jgi:hypothetical protein